MVILVVQEAVDDYGATQDKDTVVPLTMVAENRPPSPSKKMTTTKWMVVWCIIGLTAAAVASSALLFVSKTDSSSVLRATTRTEEAFLLHRKDGTCVAQSGAWPFGTGSVDDDATFGPNTPYATCFINSSVVSYNDDNSSSDLCWSRSYKNSDGDWKPCKPKGYGSGGWAEYGKPKAYVGGDWDGSGKKLDVCGPPCTLFE